MTHGSRRAARLVLTLLLAAYGISCLRHPAEFRMIDNVNLPIHETGHLVFAPFGDFIQALGGTLFELIVPAVFLGYFLTRGDRHAASVALWWIAENLWYIAVYVGDARAQDLPLVGGGEHDWAYILGELGWMARDLTIARSVHRWGVAIFIVATIWGIFEAIAMRPPESPASDDSLATAMQRA